MKKTDDLRHAKSYVCTHVFYGTRPVLLVTRPEGDWCFLCGGEHAQAAGDYRVVGTGHVLDDDPTLVDVADLRVDEEAERAAVGGPWTRADF